MFGKYSVPKLWRETVKLTLKYEICVKNESKFIAASLDMCHAWGGGPCKD
jgi:hypothetical protein